MGQFPLKLKFYLSIYCYSRVDLRAILEVHAWSLVVCCTPSCSVLWCPWMRRRLSRHSLSWRGCWERRKSTWRQRASSSVSSLRARIPSTGSVSGCGHHTGSLDSSLTSLFPPSLPPSPELVKVLHMAAMFAMVVGSELHEQAVLPKDHFLLTSITDAAVSPYTMHSCMLLCVFTAVCLNSA